MNDKNVFVCGCGHQGLAMAAHLSLNNVNVSLWNRTEKNISKVLEKHEIICNGVITGIAHIPKVSIHMEDVVSDVILVAVPSNAHKDIARELAPYVNKDMVIVLNPGRTFGAIEFAETLLQCGVKDLPHIAETQTIIYTCRRSGANDVVIHAIKEDVSIASLRNDDMEYIMEKLPVCFSKYLKVEKRLGLTSFSNVGMVLHCAPVIMNIGWIETEKVDFKYYYEGISVSVANYIEKIDAERVAVAKGFGYCVETTCEWLKRIYEVEGDSIYECIRNNSAYAKIDAPNTIYTRYLLEDIPNGLVPIEYLGKILGIATPNITNIIDIASSVTNIDFRKTGRCYSDVQLSKYNI